jgi:hypothetical protein
MLAELARKTPVARPDEFPAAHRRAAAALETLGRHGYRSAAIPRWLKPEFFGRFVVELVARYVVVSYLRRVSTEIRNLYWLRAIQWPVGTPERLVLRRARVEAEGLIVVFERRELGPALVRRRRRPRPDRPRARAPDPGPQPHPVVGVDPRRRRRGAGRAPGLGGRSPRRGDGEPAHPPRDPRAAADALGRARLRRERAPGSEPEVRSRRNRRHDADLVRRPGGARDRLPHLTGASARIRARPEAHSWRGAGQLVPGAARSAPYSATNRRPTSPAIGSFFL